MLKDWYIKLSNQRFPEEFQKLTYALMDIRYHPGIVEACRMNLHYNNPNYEEQDENTPYNAEDPYYAQRANYEVEINPAALDFTGSTVFADQVKTIIEEAEKLIVQKQNFYDQDFSVPGSPIGMQDCEPVHSEFTLEHASTWPDEFSSGKYVSIVNVDLEKLRADVQLYIDYRNDEHKQVSKAEKSKAKKGANLLSKLENLTPDEMLAEVNKVLKRQKISVSSLLETLIEDANSEGMLNVATAFYDLVNKDNWLTKDGSLAYEALDEAFLKATYDNGKPLTGYNDPKDPKVWHDYFEHYDRDQDYDHIFDDDRVTKVSYVIGSKTELKLFFDFSSDQLIAWVNKEYSGSEYAHDFK